MAKNNKDSDKAAVLLIQEIHYMIQQISHGTYFNTDDLKKYLNKFVEAKIKEHEDDKYPK